MALLLAPLRWLTSSIIRLAILAGLLVVAYLVLVKPAIESGEKKVHETLHSLESKASPAHLKRCIERADGDVDKMKRCARLF
jgi:hypothetical protein